MSSRTETEPLAPTAPLPRAAEPPPGPPATRARLTLMSFGFKFGPPAANHVFDVSFLKNPARQSGWSLWSEPDEDMARWVMTQPDAVRFLDAAVPLVQMLSGTDDDVRVAFGCSAGRHRSAILVKELAKRLEQHGIECAVEHRERAQS